MWTQSLVAIEPILKVWQKRETQTLRVNNAKEQVAHKDES